MNNSIRPLLVDIILLISIIILIFNSTKISSNFFYYIFDRKFLTRIDILYIIIYIVYIGGIHPARYLDLLKIIYKSTNLIFKFISDSNNILLYSTVINMFLIVLIQIILITQPFTKRILILLGILTAIQVICRILWGYKILNNRFNGKVSYENRMENIEAIDVIIRQIADLDYDYLYEILIKLNKDIKIISKLSKEERQKYVLQELYKLDLSKLNLKTLNNTDLNKIKNLQQSLKTLKSKLNQLENANKKNANLIKCIKNFTN